MKFDRPRNWAERHVQTLLGSLGRIVEHPLAAAMTVSVIAVALALPLFLSVILLNGRSATAGWNRGFDISVYLDKSAAPGRAATLARQLRARTDVAAVRVVSAAEALAQFREGSGFGDALDALADNPLPDSLIVTPSLAGGTAAGVRALKEVLAALPDVEIVQLDAEWVGRLEALLAVLQRIVWLLALLLGAAVALVVGNTIRLDILNRRAEIEVMKLVGASDGFARRPFLYGGVWYGLGGAVAALIVLGLTLRSLAGPVGRLAGQYGREFHLQGLGFRLSIAVVAAAAALGWLGSWVAATWHIKGMEPR